VLRRRQHEAGWQLDRPAAPATIGEAQKEGSMEGHDSMATLIGFTGVGLLLLAFVLNLAKLLKAESVPYLLLNLVGAGLACLSSWMIDFMPFVILEGTWAAATLVALLRTLSSGPRPEPG
jgi:hypothetical protein